MRYLVILLLLTACNGNGVLRGSGEVAPAPGGYTYGCAVNPDAVACGGKK